MQMDFSYFTDRQFFQTTQPHISRRHAADDPIVSHAFATFVELSRDARKGKKHIAAENAHTFWQMKRRYCRRTERLYIFRGIKAHATQHSTTPKKLAGAKKQIKFGKNQSSHDDAQCVCVCVM